MAQLAEERKAREAKRRAEQAPKTAEMAPPTIIQHPGTPSHHWERSARHHLLTEPARLAEIASPLSWMGTEPTHTAARGCSHGP